ncbi:very short patch repair endonuclease [Comamonas sp. NLF-1-9]|uniref:very short patch repair endonuclease n=1 Tax=Comamonas sp. NLF-1-9 TaxID=2853163 RepID=UPI001C447C1B|nr:very short patch repair endonuclease [Comamonas sp. NLF-1-9]QXL84417.1 very short patch repair endonuclease [Comamonas sp. NLF-1-9]
MVDVVNTAVRSRMMAGIRGKDTRPELLVRSYLHRAGLRFRLHATLPGKPDLIFPKYRVALFVHGCFWHRHENCHYAAAPSSNVQFWNKKFADNIKRDQRVRCQLERTGWRVLVIWECEMSESRLQTLAASIRSASRGIHESRE